MHPQLNQAISIFRQGGVVIFPTDTVWGIGASTKHPSAINRLYQIKNRSFSQPTAILVSDLEQAQHYGTFPPSALKLAQAHWPGALTIIVPATTNTPPNILGGGSTVGLRVPKFDLIQQLCHQLQSGIVASSANFAGASPPGERSAIHPDLIQKADFIIDYQPSLNQPPSTVINATSEKITLLRRGELTIIK